LKKGLLAENRAVEFLENRGFTVLERNFHSRYGEIDIIAQLSDSLHFVEVKSGKNPHQNMTEKKLEKILKTVDVYFQKREWTDTYENFSIDLIAIKEKKIEFIENISIL
jgi:putative endonuclease